MTRHDEALKFVRLAAQDEVVLDRLIDDEEVSDSVWAFHAQQAAEKLIKAVLLDRGVLFRKTHDLAHLHNLAAKQGLEFPVLLEQLNDLKPFAVEFRYDELSSAALDRHALREMISRIRAWCEAQVG